jgi:hypothetical protein
MGTASAFGAALAPRYGSDLLTRKLPSPCHRATPFLAPLELQEGSHALPGVSPPRGGLALARHRLRIGALWRGRPAGVAARVLTGSSKLGPSRSLPFPRRSKRPAGSHSASVRFLIAADRHIPGSQCSGGLRRLAGGMGEVSCPESPSDKPAWIGEPGASTAPDCSPVARSYLGVTRHRRCRLRVSLSFSQRTVSNMPCTRNRATKIFHKMLIFSYL